MEDIRTYRTDEDDQTRDQERSEWSAAPSDDEVPFHIPRD
jgi:hypothetical protein